ncbi:hypothetical protein [Natronorubrum sp. FCH18a]|uniref:hypothetical protein n=1 Tax=Natronorubrum sp. FCH18a TaxID=3447018 RepID=UPI003F519BCB
MNRRKVLLTSGVALSAVLAGCTSSSDDGTNGSGGSESDDEALEDAADHIVEASNRLEEETTISFETDPGDPLNTSAIEQGIENAEESLDDFNEDEASNDQLTQYENIEAAIEYTTDALEVLTELEEAFDAFDTAVSYENNERYDDAADQLEIALDHFTKADDLVDDAAESWSSVEVENTEGKLDIADGEDDLDELDDICDAYARLTEAAIDFDRGLEAFKEGTESIEQGRYSAAASAYGDATIHFEDARDLYQDAETEVPSSYREVFIDMTCVSEAIVEASELFVEASEAADRGDYQTADTRANEAQEAMDVSCGGQRF